MKKKKKKDIPLGIKERLPLIPGRKTMENKRSLKKSRRNVKAETRRAIEEYRKSETPLFLPLSVMISSPVMPLPVTMALPVICGPKCGK